MSEATVGLTTNPTIARARAIGRRRKQMSSSPTEPAVNPDARLIGLADRIRLNAEAAFNPDTPDEAQERLTREYQKLKRSLGALSAKNTEGLVAKATAGMAAFNLSPGEPLDPDHDFYVAWSACRDVLRLIGVVNQPNGRSAAFFPRAIETSGVNVIQKNGGAGVRLLELAK